MKGLARRMADCGLLRLAAHPVLVRGGFCSFLAGLMLVVVLGSPVHAYVTLPSALSAPAVVTCEYLPTPGSDVAYPCPSESAPEKPAFVNVPLRLRLVLNDPDGDLANVTIYFDYLDFLGTFIQNGSLVKNVTVSQNGPGQPAAVETDWTYEQLGFVDRPPDGSHYFVGIVATDATGAESALHYFDLRVNINSAPFVSREPPKPYDVRPFITFPNPVVPPARLDIVVQDSDDDSLIVTWDWGDGTVSANITGPSGSGARVVTTHDYPRELFRLNETPRTASFALTIYVDDGVERHNTSAGPYAVQFFLSPDDPPSSSRFVRPKDVGSLWKYGEPIPMEGFASDPQGDAIESYFWDFDSSSEPYPAGQCPQGVPAVNCDGIYDNDMEVLGNVTSHAYPNPGTDTRSTYTISLWATDGLDKKVCLDPGATTCVAPKSHWRRSQWTVNVRPNTVPIVELLNQNVSMEAGTPLRATVFDQDGDPLNLTWSFGDGTNGTTNVTWRPSGEPIIEPYQDATSLIVHEYPRAGEFYVLSVRVTDGEATDEATARVFVSSANLPPSPALLRLLRANDTAALNGTYLPNETVRLEIVLADPENDTLEVHIAWGDGDETLLKVTLPEGSVTGASGASCRLNELNQTVCHLDHAYADVSNYTIIVNLTDNRRFVVLNATTFKPEDVVPHSVAGSVTLFVKVPVTPKSEGPWDWWDYSTLGAVLGIPLLLVTRGLVRLYRERREE